jgi:cobalt/nickel transport protein
MNRRNWLAVILVGIGIALAITLFSPWASSHPDGLEKVAEEEGFLEEAEGPSYEIIPDYQFPGVENERLATVLAGIAGVLMVAALTFGVGILLQSLARSRAERAAATDGPPAGTTQRAGG